MGNGSALGQTSNQSLSRIEQDTEAVKRLSEQVEIITSRITAHARALGYFGPPQDANAKQVGAAPTPVVTTLADALGRLSREIDHASGALNVFD